MTDSLSRAFVADIEVRSGGDGRTVSGIVVPFGRVARVSDGGASYDEAFEKGSFAKTIRQRGDRVKLLSQHNARANPLGRATALREDEAGLYGEFRVSATAAGDEALELLRDGALDSFSVGFAPISHAKRGRVTWRTEVALREASLVTFPAYEDARVEAVRMLEGLSEEDMRMLADRLLVNLPDLRSAVEATELGTLAEVAPVESGPADATPLDVSKQFRSLRRLAREKGVLL